MVKQQVNLHLLHVRALPIKTKHTEREITNSWNFKNVSIQTGKTQYYKIISSKSLKKSEVEEKITPRKKILGILSSNDNLLILLS